MSGDSKKRLIFSIYTKVEEDEGFVSKRQNHMNQFETHFDKLKYGLENYANICNADFKLIQPDVQHFDNLNNYKIELWEDFCEDYDEVLYFDFDIIPNTTKNIFESFDCEALFMSTHSTDGYNCMPKVEQWVKTINVPGRYLNSGVYIGKTSFIKELYLSLIHIQDY